MKWVVGSFAHETNTFSTVLTDMDAFRAQQYLVGHKAIRSAHSGNATVLGGFLDAIDRHNDEVVLTVASHATPSGLVTREAFDTQVGHILEGVRVSPDADGVLLGLHGAMVAEGLDDGEGETIRRVREAVGSDKPIVVVLDLHSHITDLMVDHATTIIGYQKYPHTDMSERGVEAAELIARIARGEVRPVASLKKPAMMPPVGTCHTEAGLYADLWADALRPGRPSEILTTSLFAGFPFADVPSLGYAVLTYADGDQSIADSESARLANAAWERREAFSYHPTSIEDAVTRGRNASGGPVVIADMADNPGGGSSNDGVELLRELIKQKVTSAAFGTVYDPSVVQEAIRVGVDQAIKTSLGAKTDGMHGNPIEIEGRVRFIYNGKFQYKGPMSCGAWGDIGTAAVINVNGIDVIVCSKRMQTRDPEVFRSAGIDPFDSDILAVKSAVHFRAGFKTVAKSIIIADGPGLTSLDLSIFPYTRIRRPMWPIDL
ncbi:MAG: M81 family metallopeptidase [Candidatus Latescibacterota bacterium]|nr:M81 family metallopeptidase [Candidatus Latescibacterota bacterium]